VDASDKRGHDDDEEVTQSISMERALAREGSAPLQALSPAAGVAAPAICGDGRGQTKAAAHRDANHAPDFPKMLENLDLAASRESTRRVQRLRGDPLPRIARCGSGNIEVEGCVLTAVERRQSCTKQF
jgi:hypothetical protein